MYNYTKHFFSIALNTISIKRKRTNYFNDIDMRISISKTCHNTKDTCTLSN